MPLKQFRIFFLAVFWALSIILWPKATNQDNDDSLEHTRTAEGLYKTSPLRAKLGLLGVKFYETKGGKKRWRILAESAELHRKENYAFLQTVNADFLAARTKNLINATSHYGFSYTDKNWMRLQGDVHVQSKKGYLFTMEVLDYNGNTHEFTSTDVVHMKGPNSARPTMILYGTGLSADIDQEHFIMQRNVHATRKLKTGELLRISSDIGEFFTDEQRAIFLNHVRAFLPNIQIRSDIFEIHAQESFEARGNVLLRNKDRIGRAETAFLESGNSQIILEGNARVDSKDNQVKGRRIFIYSDDDRIEVDEAEGTVRH